MQRQLFWQYRCGIDHLACVLATVYLTNGISLKGDVQTADAEVIWLKFNGHSHLIQKTMIATILFQ